MKKNIVSIVFLLLFSIVFAFGQSGGESVSKWDGSARIENYTGKGTVTEPYLIESAAQFAGLVEHVDKTDTRYKYYKLTTNIDLDNNPWTPIGIGTKSFGGIFDGGGHWIKGLLVNKDSNLHKGLFGRIVVGWTNAPLSQEYPGIRNLTLLDGSVEGFQMVGAFCGEATGNDKHYVYFENCHNNGVNVTSIVESGSSGNNVGGIVGRAGANIVVRNCSNSGVITGRYFVGGLVGEYLKFSSSGSLIGAEGAKRHYAIIEKSHNNGVIRASAGYVGGILGSGTISINECYNTGDIVSLSNNTGKSFGGIVGVSPNIDKVAFPMRDGYDYGVYKCANYGYIEGYTNTGGIAGFAEMGIKNCYNTSEVKNKMYNTGGNTGGIVGYNMGDVSNCYNMGRVLTNNNLQVSIGEIIGNHYVEIGTDGTLKKGLVSRCYYDNQFNRADAAIGNVEIRGTNTGGVIIVDEATVVGKSTDELSRQDAVATLFNNDPAWISVDNNRYLELNAFKGLSISTLYAQAVKLSKDNRWNSVNSDFYLHNGGGVSWTSSNPTLVTIVNSSLGVLSAGKGNADVIARLGNMERTVSLKLIQGTNTVRFPISISGSGKIFNRGIQAVDKEYVTIRDGGELLLEIVPDPGSYLDEVALVNQIFTDGKEILNRYVIVTFDNDKLILRLKLLEIIKLSKSTNLEGSVLSFTFKGIEALKGTTDFNEPFGNGGTEYMIYRPSELNWLSKEKTNGTNVRIKLMNNIDMNHYQWNPYGGGLDFSGLFDGNCNSIVNINIEATNNEALASLSSNGNVGFFSSVASTGQIKRLGLVNSLMDFDLKNATSLKVANIGSIVGQNKGLVSDCYVSGTLKVSVSDLALANVGGIVGHNFEQGNVNGVVKMAMFLGTMEVSKGSTAGTLDINRGALLGFCGDYGTWSSTTGLFPGAGNSGSGKDLFFLIFDNQMTCNINDGTMIPAVGNTLTGITDMDAAIVKGVPTMVLTSGTLASGSNNEIYNTWVPTPGQYPMLKKGVNYLPTVAASSVVRVNTSENFGGVKSDFLLTNNLNGIVNTEPVWKITPDNGLVKIVKKEGGSNVGQIIGTDGGRILLEMSVGGVVYKSVSMMVSKRTDLTDYTLNVKSNGTKEDKISISGSDLTTGAITENGYSGQYYNSVAYKLAIKPNTNRYVKGILVNGVESKGRLSFDPINSELYYLLTNTESLTNKSIVIDFANVPAWDGTVPMDVDDNSWMPHNDALAGSEAFNYAIYHPNELAWIACQVNENQNETFYMKSVKLMNDLDMSNGDRNWVAIGGYSTSKQTVFRGNLQGNNKTLSNITIKKDATSGSVMSCAGLFGILASNSNVSDLTIKNPKIEGGIYVGGICGYLGTATNEITGVIKNCKVVAEGTGSYIRGITSVGGIVGRSSSHTEVINCTNEGVPIGTASSTDVGGIIGTNNGLLSMCINRGKVIGLDYVGGITGNSKGVESVSIVQDCYNEGEIVGENYVGGIVGRNDVVSFDVNIIDCYNIGSVSGFKNVGGIIGELGGTVETSYNLGNVSGCANVGGIIGVCGGRVIRKCFNTGVISYNTKFTDRITDISGIVGFGGIVGSSIDDPSHNRHLVEYCYNVGDIDGRSAPAISEIGGIAGKTRTGFTECYNAGSICVNHGSGKATFFGALAGNGQLDKISACFYDKQISTAKAIDNTDVIGIEAVLTKDFWASKIGTLDNNIWEVSDNLYPMIKSLVQKDEIRKTHSILSCIPLQMDASDNGSKYDQILIATNNILLPYSGAAVGYALPGCPECEIGGVSEVADAKLGKRTVEGRVIDEIQITRGDMYGVNKIQVTINGLSVSRYFGVLPQGSGTKTFTPQGSNNGRWNVSGNWTPEGVPMITNDIVIPEGKEVIVDAKSSCQIAEIKGKMTIKPTGSLKAGAVLTDGDPNQILIQNDATNSAIFIIQNESVGAPYVTVKQILTTGVDEGATETEGTGVYQLISNPVGDIPVGQGVVDVFKGAWLDRWNQYTAEWERYENKKFPIEKFRGYAVNYAEQTKEITFKGEMYNGMTIYRLSYDGDADRKDISGLNLIGNPYVAPLKIDWSAITIDEDPSKENIYEEVWFWNSKRGNYVTFTQGSAEAGITTNVIPPLQGFWVKVKPIIFKPDENINKNDTIYTNYVELRVPYSLVTDEYNNGLYKSNVDARYVKLDVSGKYYSDMVVIAENDNCTSDYDMNYDGEKWLSVVSGVPQIYAIEGERILAIDMKDDCMETKLGFIPGKDKEYVIKIADEEHGIPGMKNMEEVNLIDLKTGVTHDLLKSEYGFSSDKNDLTNRFVLNLKSIKNVSEEMERRFNIYSYKNRITIIGDGIDRIEVIDITGRLVSVASLSDDDEHSLTISKSGIYIVRAFTGNYVETRKVIIN